MPFTRARSPVRSRQETRKIIFSSTFHFLKFTGAGVIQRLTRTREDWLFGLGVWFSLRVREVPGSNPGGAQFFLCVFSLLVKTHVCIVHTLYIVHVIEPRSLLFHTLLSLHKAGQDSETRSLSRSYGVMVSTLDSESSDPSSNLGRTSHFYYSFCQLSTSVMIFKNCNSTIMRPW